MDTAEEYNRRKKLRLAERMRNAESPKEALRLAVIIYGNYFKNDIDRNSDGGPGSGNWGHEGRKGEIGGSKSGGGVHNRQTTESGSYTSFSKTKKAAAKSHKTDSKELQSVPKGSVMQTSNGSKFIKSSDSYGDYLLCFDTGEIYYTSDEYDCEILFEDYGDEAKIYIPDAANPNYSVTKTMDAKSYDEKLSNSFNAGSPQEFDDAYRQQSGDIYASLDSQSKKALNSYTNSGYVSINQNLRAGETGSDSINDKIDRITDAIDQSELQSDTVLYRECTRSAMEKLLRMEKGTLTSSTADSIVGKSGTDDAFMSTSSSQQGDYGGVVKMQILAPKGTKALYAEPFSACGDGAGYNWDSLVNRDGKSSQSHFSNEDETILQRGTSISVVSGGYNSASKQFEYKVLVTGQDYENTAYNKARKK